MCPRTTCIGSVAPARAGATGEAISLVCADDKPLLTDIERVIRRQVPREIVAGFEPNPHERAEPIVRQRGPGKSERGQRDRPQRSAARRPSQGQPRKNAAARSPPASRLRSRTDNRRAPRKRTPSRSIRGRHRNHGVRLTTRRRCAPTFRDCCNRRIVAGANLAHLAAEVAMESRRSAARRLKSGTTQRQSVSKLRSTGCCAAAITGCTATR